MTLLLGIVIGIILSAMLAEIIIAGGFRNWINYYFFKRRKS